MRKILLISLFLLLLSSVCSAEANWKSLVEPGKFLSDIQVDENSIKYGTLDNGNTNYSIVFAWVKYIYTEDGKKGLLKAWEEKGIETKEYRRFLYRVGQYKYYMKEKQWVLLKDIYYNSDGEVIQQINILPKNEELMDVVPGSNGETIYDYLHKRSFSDFLNSIDKTK